MNDIEKAIDALKTVNTKWNTDGRLAVIYKIGNILIFYSTDKDPNFEKGQSLTLEEVQKTDYYKVVRFSMDAIPSDAYIPF